jgi:hypothetical protein
MGRMLPAGHQFIIPGLDSEDIPSLLCYTKVYYRVRKNLPLNPILSQMSPINTLTAAHFVASYT